jgi:hypothetical protein
MYFFRYRPFRPRLALLPRVLLAAAIATGVILATVGAVIGVALLAAGAIVHTIVRQFRGPAIAATASGPRADAHGVIEGEFVVVSDNKQPPLPPN